MKIEVGKVYKCGDTFVKIIKKLAYIQLACLLNTYEYLGVEWDIDSDECANLPYIGRFSASGDGIVGSNPDPLRNFLEEIEDQIVEMTVSEISKALGKQIKIVKEKG